MTGLKKLLMWKAAGGGGGQTETLSGSLVTFETSKARPLQQCRVDFLPKQSGSGDPSPENVRPISGWDGLSVFVSPTTIGGTEYPVSWQSAGTVYGGYVDLVTGVLVAEWQTFDLSTNSWYKTSNIFYTNISNATAESTGLYCSSYKVSANNDSDNSIRRYNYNGNARVSVRDDARYSMTVQEFAEYMKDVQIVTELASPITYTLTPQQITTLIGTNNIWSDAGDVTVTYTK